MAKNKENQKSVVRENPIDAILDPNNNDNIILVNMRDEEVEFEQIALVPLPDDSLYVILRPANDPNVKENEAVVFVIELDDEDMEYYLNVVEDDDIIDAVFEEYKKMFNEESSK